jgi:hypothetical protein
MSFESKFENARSILGTFTPFTSHAAPGYASFVFEEGQWIVTATDNGTNTTVRIENGEFDVAVVAAVDRLIHVRMKMRLPPLVNPREATGL